MFYLAVNMGIGEYYPSIFTQFVIGTICYIITFLISREIVSQGVYEEYYYHIFSLIVIDITYLMYRSKNSDRHVNEISEKQNILPKKLSSNPVSEDDNDSLTIVSDTLDIHMGYDTESVATDDILMVSYESDRNDNSIGYKLSEGTDNTDIF
jgi:hypothetical protein